MNTIKEIENYLNDYIPDRIENNFFGKQGLDRVKYFAELIGNPQEKINIIHIAGTSGKGSTATILSFILNSFNLKIGLQISPHLIDIRERCQINNQLLSEKQFVQYFQKIVLIIDKMSQSKFGKPTYFEIITILAWYIFWKENVSYAIVETGLGGLYDATNIIKNKNKIAVLTNIGKDHTEILGTTIEKIALQKVGIVQQNNKVFSINQPPKIKKILDDICLSKNSKISYINNRCKFKLNLNGNFQKKNCALALEVAKYLSIRDEFKFNEQKIQKMLLKIKFSGRFEIKQFGNKVVVFDGAHNVQKMNAFLIALRKKYPKRKFDFLIAFKIKKDFFKILQKIIKIADNIIITDFKNKRMDLNVLAEKNQKISNILDKLKYTNYTIISDSISAFTWCVQNNNNKILVVTGSLYLISEIYKHYGKE